MINFPGNYSVYGFEIRLTRSLGPFILSVYLPSAMFVTMSWVSFFIPPVRRCSESKLLSSSGLQFSQLCSCLKTSKMIISLDWSCKVWNWFNSFDTEIVKVLVFGLGHYNKRKNKCTLTLETCSVFVFIVLITFYILSLIHSNLWGTVVVLIKSLFHERVSLLCTEAVKRKID